MLINRTYELNNNKYSGGPVIYRISRDLRTSWNDGLNYASKFASETGASLIIALVLSDYFLHTDRRLKFFKEGLTEFAANISKLNYGLLIFNDGDEFLNSLKSLNPGLIVTDFYPLKSIMLSNAAIAETVDCEFIEIDSHNIVPARFVSNKQEFAAYTIRSKINKLLPEFLTPSKKPTTVSAQLPDKFKVDINNISTVLQNLSVTKIGNAPNFVGGEAAADNILQKFLNHKLSDYSENRNDPSLNNLSDLSPYINFGFISARKIAYELYAGANQDSNISAFLEELIIRRELSDNFCLYNTNYDNYLGLPEWGRKTLDIHRNDPREYTYSEAQFESAETHDKYWNAAQIQMRDEGKMHGYMRMYWAKKILEWSSSPEEAFNIALKLNDKYELDGCDPNGFTGVAWSIGGLHDRAWKERDIFGKIRYMNAAGLKRKFDIETYTNKYLD